MGLYVHRHPQAPAAVAAAFPAFKQPHPTAFPPTSAASSLFPSLVCGSLNGVTASQPPVCTADMTADKSASVELLLGSSFQALSLGPERLGADYGSSSAVSNGDAFALLHQGTPSDLEGVLHSVLNGGSYSSAPTSNGYGRAPYANAPSFHSRQGTSPPSAGVAMGFPGIGAKSGSKVFVGGLSWETSDQKLRQYFENYGEVLEAFVSYDKNTGRPRGFGFVVFAEPHIADKVVSLQHTIDRREVEAKKAVPRQDMTKAQNGMGGDSTKVKKIFVGGLAPTVDEKAFREYFEQYGEVEDAVVMYDPHSSRPRGFGFVTFGSVESVDHVFLRGVMQELHEKQIEIKRAVPREEMAPPRRVRGAHGAPGFNGRSGGQFSHLPKHAYNQPPPSLQQAIPGLPQHQGNPALHSSWAQQNFLYPQHPGCSLQQQAAAAAAAVAAASCLQPGGHDRSPSSMYSNLTAGLAAANSLGFSNGLGLIGSRGSLPSGIDMGPVDAAGKEASQLPHSVDVSLASRLRANSPGGMQQLAGSYPEDRRSPDGPTSSSYQHDMVGSLHEGIMSGSFSSRTGYGLGGFGSSSFHGTSL
mmetsp:Transcript_830/g.2508  ORF Transcript_830/g.2508 Transcript_830/m.2508 type:complete len:583 (+) Transcript_830:851-2599(+)